jgi:hypothetical protein
MDPFYGRGDFMVRAMEIYEKMNEICRSGYEFHGKPLSLHSHFLRKERTAFSMSP